MKRILILIALYLTVSYAFSQKDKLEYDIEKIIEGKQATVGVGLIIDGRDTLIINNNYQYPTLSVYKFHQALAVLHYMQENNIPLEEKVFVTKDDLLPNTHSPLRDSNPDGNYYISLGDLMKYSVSKSDNNACDILFKYIGGTKEVDQYIRNTGIKDFQIAATEAEMHESFENQYLNWSTPFSAVCLLEEFKNKNLLAPTYQDFLWETMVGTTTGGNKIKGLLPKDVIVAHKTGSSFRNEDRLKAAENDIAIVSLPNGNKYSLAIFVKDSKESDDVNAEIIANISKAVYDYVISQESK